MSNVVVTQPAVTGRSAASVQVLRALADPTRQKLLQLLVTEELSVTELVDILRLPQSTLSRHLGVLRTTGLARGRRDGTTALYSATHTAAEDESLQGLLLEWLRGRPLPQGVRDRLGKVLRRREDETIGFFDRLGSRWDELRGEAFGEAFAMEAFLSLLPAGWTVADIGTGTGYLLPVLAQHFRRVIAVEPAGAMLECARRRVAESGSCPVTFHHGDLGRLPIRDRTCDLVIACLVLHHVEEPGDALCEMHRVVRPGGRILIVEQQAHRNRAFRDVMQDRWWGFNPSDLVRRATAAGFRRVRQHALRTARARTGAIESPGLFVVTGERPGPQRRES